MSWNKFYFVRKTDSGHVFSDCYGQSKTQVLHMNMDKFARGVSHSSTKPYFNELQFNMVFYDKSKIAHGIVLSHDVGKLMSFKLKDSTQGISIDVKVQDDTVSELYSTESLVKTRQQLLKTLKMMWDVATGKEPDIQVIVSKNIINLISNIMKVSITFNGNLYQISVFEFLLLSKQGRDFIYMILK